MLFDRSRAVLQDVTQLFESGTVSGTTEGELLERFLSTRSETAIAALVDRLGPMVLGTCRRLLHSPHDVDDAFQATFLVLARKAKTLGNRNAVGPWLHGVAYRVAMRARWHAKKRRELEQTERKGDVVADVRETLDPDLREVLDAEVRRLPKKYLDLVVLCYLEGRTQAEAAVLLRLTPDAVRGRLERARALLRTRLQRRGIGPAALGAMATAFVASAEAATRIVPPALAESAVLLVIKTVGSAAAATLVSAHATRLSREVIRSMSFQKISVATAWVFSLALAVSAAELVPKIIRAAGKEDIAVAQQAVAAPKVAPAPVREEGKTPLPEGVVVDNQNRPIAGVEVVLAPGAVRDVEKPKPIIDRAITDAEGQFRMPPPPREAFGGTPMATLWAMKDGFGLGAASYVPFDAQEAVRIRLDPPGTRVITFRKRDGTPMVGVKVTPSTFSVPNTRGYKADRLPGIFAERIAQVTDAEGKVAFAAFAPKLRLSQVIVSAPGIGSQFILVTNGVNGVAERVELTLEPAGALAGKVIRNDGKSPEGLIVNVHSALNDPVAFDAGPIRVGADGTYRTPPSLLHGTRYRVTVREPGLGAVSSDLIDAPGAGKTATVVDLVFDSLHKVSGRVIDRQGKPILGAEVIQSRNGPERTTAKSDLDGRFALGGFRSGPALIAAHAEGFRYAGRIVADGENEIVLTRISEKPERPMPALPPILSAEEARTLTHRLLDSYLAEAIAAKDYSAISKSLLSLMPIDQASALVMLNQGALPNDAFVRGSLVSWIALTDLDQAVEVAEAAREPGDRANALVSIVNRLPRDQITQRLAVLDHAIIQSRASTKPEDRMWQLGEVGERLCEIGENERAKPIFAEGLAVAKTIPHSRSRPEFAARLARVDLPAALALIEEIADAEHRSRAFANTALHLADNHPEACEQVLARARAFDQQLADAAICERMALIDSARSRRVTRGDSPPDRMAMRLSLAHGLARSPDKKDEAVRLFREAMAALDDWARGDSTDPPIRSLELYLPVVEDIEPDLVPEFLWRVLAARGPARSTGALSNPAATRLITAAARYDRQIAAVLFAPLAANVQKIESKERLPFLLDYLESLTRLDPKAAVQLVESLPKPDGPSTRLAVNRIRLEVALWVVRSQRPGEVQLLNGVVGPWDYFKFRDLP